MAYLHKDKEEFINAVNLASEYFHILPIIVEKDYYVTMILRELSERQGFVVFKGGTSLSKCHKAIKRFSEDIDITIDSRLSPVSYTHLFWSWREVICNHDREMLKENLLNFILLLPAGILLPLIANHKIKWYQALLIGILLSATIELSQLIFMRGLFEWDDMIHNGLGYMAG